MSEHVNATHATINALNAAIDAGEASTNYPRAFDYTADHAEALVMNAERGAEREHTVETPAQAVTRLLAELDQSKAEAARLTERGTAAIEHNAILDRYLTQSREDHRQDIALIGETLMEEAEARNWCEQYDEAVATMNERLNVELPTRSRPYTVAVNVTVTVSVSATSDDDAISQAESIMETVENRIDRTADAVSEISDSSGWDVERDDN